MRSDYEPILINLGKELAYAEVYAVGDIHYGSAQFDERKWEALKTDIMSVPNRYMVFVGDAMENAIPGSKSSVFEQVKTPFEQREWVTEQFTDMKDRILAVVDGNHERNRSVRTCDLYPLYDACCLAGIADRYRPHFAFVDIGVGTRKRDPNQQVHYVGLAIHKMKDTKQYCGVDFVEGIDFGICGHTHSPLDVPRGKLVYDSKLKQVRQVTTEFLNAGSFMRYGGYSVDNAYRPTADKLYKLVLMGGEKQIGTAGFYV